MAKELHIKRIGQTCATDKFRSKGKSYSWSVVIHKNIILKQPVMKEFERIQSTLY